MDGLLTAAVLIRNVLASPHDALGDKPTFIVLDDFYHVPFDDQPDVLAYLHQVVKNLDIFLRVCGIRHRLQPFVEGDPPRGMQIGQDAAEICWTVLLIVSKPCRVSWRKFWLASAIHSALPIDALITKGGRQRLVLGSGGVARDYLYLTQNALRNANERTPTHHSRTTEAAELSALK